MAHGAHQGAERPGPGRADNPSALPYAKAFIVQFGAETDARLGHVTGRVEHLHTGRRSRFASVDELLAWMMATLAGVAASPEDGGWLTTVSDAVESLTGEEKGDPHGLDDEVFPDRD